MGSMLLMEHYYKDFPTRTKQSWLLVKNERRLKTCAKVLNRKIFEADQNPNPV